MSDPSGTVAAIGAVAVSTTGTATVLSWLPPGTSLDELAWASIFAIFGAFCYQFICAMVARQKSADAGTPMEQRPRIDMIILAYSMCGAPLAASFAMYLVHLGGGTTSGPMAVPGFMAAGAFAPLVVARARDAFSIVWGAKNGSGKT